MQQRECDSRCPIWTDLRTTATPLLASIVFLIPLFQQRVWSYQHSSLLGHTPLNTHIARVVRWWNPGQFSWAWIWALYGRLMQRDLASAAWRWGDQTQPSFSLSTDASMQREERARETYIREQPSTIQIIRELWVNWRSCGLHYWARSITPVVLESIWPTLHIQTARNSG